MLVYSTQLLFIDLKTCTRHKCGISVHLGHPIALNCEFRLMYCADHPEKIQASGVPARGRTGIFLQCRLR